jgi:hypothetical protein
VLAALVGVGAGCTTATTNVSSKAPIGAPTVDVLPNGLTLIVQDHRAAEIVAVHL